MEQSPFHTGEIAIQQRIGEAALAFRNGRVISTSILRRAWNFLENQPFILISSQDQNGQVWTSLVSGEPGFVRVADELTLQINLTLVGSNPWDLCWQNLRERPSIGILFIELSSRRRFRVNGKVSFQGNTLEVKVEQGFPNCPKFIQSRQVTVTPKSAYDPGFQTGKELTGELKDWIASADTFFVGSTNLQGDLDVSHRGGPPGFVAMIHDLTLQIPDYKGNSLYNTLGNFMVNPQAGLLFLDFTRHRALQLTGTARIIWTEEEALVRMGGTSRLWEFHIQEWRQLENGKNLHWEFSNYSPFNPA